MNGNGSGHQAQTARLDAIAVAQVGRFLETRTAEAAERLSLAGAALAAATICNEAILRLIALAYETDTTGRPNVDRDGRLLIPTPWGRNGRARYGLRATEADVLRRHVQILDQRRRPAPFLRYDVSRRRWSADMDQYPTREEAVEYWQLVGLVATSYRQHADTLRTNRTQDAD